MPSRFSSRVGGNHRSESDPTRGEGFGEWWAAIAVIALIAMALVSLLGSAEPRIAISDDAGPRIMAALDPAQRSLNAVEAAFGSLCQQPVLLALELEPDCESGVITLPDDLFEGDGKDQLGSEAREDIAAAMTTYLAQLRTLPALWESLEAIEIRGHADPRAIRDPYSTNMVGSQQRALGVLLFLVGPEVLSEPDRIELQRLGIVSGVSFARPPASCPEPSRECYPEWRRVEIRPVLSESSRRDDWTRAFQDARNAALQVPRSDSSRVDSTN